MGARFSATVQTGPGAHPASCTMGTGSFSGVKCGRGVMLTPHPLLVPWSRKSRATLLPLLPLWAVRPVQSLSASTRVHYSLPVFVIRSGEASPKLRPLARFASGRSGDRIPVGAIFSAPVQLGPGAHPASCTMGTGSFPGVKCGHGVMLTPHPLLVPWSRKSRAIPLLPLWVVRPVQSLSVCTRVKFTFFTT